MTYAKRFTSVKRICRTALFVLLTVVSFGSCSMTDNPKEKRILGSKRLLKKQNIVKIAVTYSFATEQETVRHAYELAKDEINAKGGILGGKLEVEYFDDGGMVKTATPVAYTICSDNSIPIVIQHSLSDVAIANSLIYQYYGLFQFCPISTSVDLTNLGLMNIFRNIPTDNLTGKNIAQFAASQEWQNFLIYSSDTHGGEGISNAFEFWSSTMDINIVDREVYTLSDTKNIFMKQANEWIRDVPLFDAVLVAGDLPQSAEVAAAFREAGITVPIIGGDAFSYEKFFDIAGTGKLSSNVYTVTNFEVDATDDAFLNLRKNFFERYKMEPDLGTMQAHDALHVIAAAINECKSLNPDDISATMLSHGTWNESAGPYQFTANGDLQKGSLAVMKTENGTFVKVSN